MQTLSAMADMSRPYFLIFLISYLFTWEIPKSAVHEQALNSMSRLPGS